MVERKVLLQMEILRGFVLGVQRLNDGIGKGASYMILGIIGVALFEVIARFVFHNPTKWGHELTELLFGVFVIIAGGFCLLHDRHVRADFLWGQWSLKRKAIADLAASGLSLLFIGSLFWLSIPFAWHSFQVRETSATIWAPPVYPFKFIMIIGVVLLLLEMVAKVIRDTGTVRGYTFNRSE